MPRMLFLVFTPGFLACGNDPVEPPSERGTIEVTSATAGDPTDPDGYVVAVDGGEGTALGVNSTLTLSEVATGEHQLELGGIAPNCAVAGTNPRTVAVSEGGIARTSFEVECTTLGGSLEIRTTTTGRSPDPDGYMVALDQGTEVPIAANGMIAFTGVTAGVHQVGLTGLASNCTLAGQNPRTVAIANGGSRQISFELSCLDRGEGIILFTSDRTGTSHLFRVRDDGTGIVDLTPSAEACCGDWSPDGSRIAFSAEPGISVMSEDGSDPVALGVSGGSVRWSPDGQKLLFTSGGTFAADGTIQVMNADGSGVTELTTGRSPDWSPGGTGITFQRTGPCVVDICGADVYVMTADGSQVRKLTNSQGPFDFFGLPAWSPDGSKIAYRRSAFFGGSGVYVMNPDGSGKAPITALRGLGRPVWSPDGSAIAVAALSADGGSTELTVIPSRGGQGVVVASSPGAEYPESWK